MERLGIQQCQRYPSSSQQPLEARYPDVQQVELRYLILRALYRVGGILSGSC